MEISSNYLVPVVLEQSCFSLDLFLWEAASDLFDFVGMLDVLLLKYCNNRN
jgi:hypothetical protein